MKISSFVLAGVLGCAATVACAHAKLEASEPKASSVLEQAPQRIRLQFNEVLEPAFSKIELADAHGGGIALSRAALDKDNRKALAAALPALRAGQYRIRWTAMGHDGHKTKGEFSFTVK
jgi:methionine-rich copper-binding protein CopC